jgi:hypothetical protein
MAAIHYLKRGAIDDAKWNACLDAASNGLIYGYTFYLDAICSEWDALVLDDYKAIMPLPWRRKWGIQYLYQPFAIAQLGLFGNNLSAELLYGFLKKIPPHFRYWDLPLNYANHFTVPSFPIYKRENFVLQLNQSYEAISAQYRPYIRRNTRKAQAIGCTIRQHVDIDVISSLAKNHNANKGSEAEYKRFTALFSELVQKNKAITYAVQTASGQVLASAVFFYSHQRAYYILPGNHPDGRKAGASHLLIDAFIKDHAGSNLVLDFEGSDVPGLQFFYASFGAVEEPYTAIRHNRLPFFLRWLKKS